MERTERPSTKRVMMYCENCNCQDKHFMTNKQIYEKSERMVWCDVCDKITAFRI